MQNADASSEAEFMTGIAEFLCAELKKHVPNDQLRQRLGEYVEAALRMREAHAPLGEDSLDHLSDCYHKFDRSQFG